MIAKTKQVYYCEYCKRHGLARRAMEKHEEKCTLNQGRVCRWRLPESRAEMHVADIPGLVPLVQHRAPLDQADIVWLCDEVGGCPACMLAALRQSGVEYHYDAKPGAVLWEYGAEVERFRASEREAQRQAEYDDLMATMG